MIGYIFITIIAIGIVWLALTPWGKSDYNVSPVVGEYQEALSQDENNLDQRLSAIEEILTKELAEQDTPEYVMIIKAMLNNLRKVKHKQMLINSIRILREDMANRSALKELINKLDDQILHSDKPEYSDMGELTDETTLKLYKELGEAYDSLSLDLPRFNSFPYRIDLSENHFFYLRVGDCYIPQFVGKDEKRTYLYPTCAVTLEDDIEFQVTDITNVNVSVKPIPNADRPTCILKIDLNNLEILSYNPAAAERFHKAFEALKTHLTNKEWGMDNLAAEESRKDIEIKNALKKLDGYIGLESVKKDLRDIANFIKIQQLRKFKGLKCLPVSYHYVFTGNPGTGKTTMARVLADIYKELGVVTSGHLVETDRSGLVAEYVGQTAVKTNKVIDEALGGVLFIDEAYSLVPGGSDDFGTEAISTLLKRMEDDRDNLVVVLAGYSDEMKKFIDSNPGLESRFNRYIHFDDYTAEELFEIFMLTAKGNDYIIEKEAQLRLKEILCDAVAHKDKNFGNGRFIRNVFEKTCQRQATRLSSFRNPPKEEMLRIVADDLPA